MDKLIIVEEHVVNLFKMKYDDTSFESLTIVKECLNILTLLNEIKIDLRNESYDIEGCIIDKCGYEEIVIYYNKLFKY